VRDLFDLTVARKRAQRQLEFWIAAGRLDAVVRAAAEHLARRREQRRAAVARAMTARALQRAMRRFLPRKGHTAHIRTAKAATRALTFAG